MDRRAFIFGLFGAGAVVGAPEKAEARSTATFTIPKGKRSAHLKWIDKNGGIKYSTNLNVQPGQKFRITTR